jgi:hypothetical protein
VRVHPVVEIQVSLTHGIRGRNPGGVPSGMRSEQDPTNSLVGMHGISAPGYDCCCYQGLSLSFGKVSVVPW